MPPTLALLLAALAGTGTSLGLDTRSPLELGVVELRRLGVTSREGIVVIHVYAMSPAARAGLREGDVLLRMDGVELNTRDDLSAVVARHNPLDRVAIEYLRGGRQESALVTLGSAAEMWVKACEARDPGACFAAGNRFRKGEGVPRDSAKAATYLEQGCWLEEFGACINLGRMLRDGEGIQRDAAKAVSLFQRACEAGVPEGCHHLGLQYTKGDGVGRDAERGRELTGQACAMGDEDACPAVLQRPAGVAAPAAAAVDAGPACQGTYSLGGGSFSFSKDVTSALDCAAAAAEHARTICKIKRLGADSAAHGQWSFRQGNQGAVRAFTASCP